MKQNLSISKISLTEALNQHNPSDLEQLSNKIFLGLDLSKATITDYKYRIGKFIEFVFTTGFERNTLLKWGLS